MHKNICNNDSKLQFQTKLLLFCSLVLTISINVLKCICNENFDFVIFNLHYLKISTFPIILIPTLLKNSNLKDPLVLWIFWRSNFENTSYITRENQSYSLCKSTKICIAYTDAFTLMISFVFSS